MLQNGFAALNLGNLPMNLQSMPSLQGMSGGLMPPTTDPTKQPPTPPQSELDKFGNWTGQTDTKVMAQDLKKRGLIGAQQLIDDSPNANDSNSIRNSQSDWKVAAIQNILANAKKFNIRTPEAFDANMPALTSTLNPQYQEALKNPSFAIAHPNFPEVVKGILKDQWAKDDKQNSIAKK